MNGPFSRPLATFEEIDEYLCGNPKVTFYKPNYNSSWDFSMSNGEIKYSRSFRRYKPTEEQLLSFFLGINEKKSTLSNISNSVFIEHIFPKIGCRIHNGNDYDYLQWSSDQ